MARCVVDGEAIYNKGWSQAVRDVFFYLLTVAANGFGMCRYRPATIAEASGMSRDRVAQCVEVLIEQEVLLRWEVMGVTYLAFVNWQDYQRRQHPGKSTCPCPPPELFTKLSEKTRELFTTHSGKLLPAVVVVVAGAVAGAVDAAKNQETPSASPPACSSSRARKLTDEQNGEKQTLIDHFYQRLQKRTGIPNPEFAGGQAASFFARRLRAGDAYEDLRESIDHFFDKWANPKGAANFAHYQRAFNGIVKAITGN